MEIVRSHLHGPEPAAESIVPLVADRTTLAKRRWRGVASDGRDFGFDLDHALADGDVIFRDGETHYVVTQSPEPVLEILLTDSASLAATIAWQIGNLHFPVEVTDEVIRVADDPAVRQLFAREGYSYIAGSAVFRPIHAAGHGHHHHH